TSEPAAAAMPRADRDAPQPAPRPTPRAPEPTAFDEARPRGLDAVRQFPADAWRPEPESARLGSPAGNSPAMLEEPDDQAAAPIAQDQHPVSAEPSASAKDETSLL